MTNNCCLNRAEYNPITQDLTIKLLIYFIIAIVTK